MGLGDAEGPPTRLEQEPETNYAVFVGGYDLEMQEIKRILEEKGINIVDKQLGWGAESSAYNAELKEAMRHGRVLVLIELKQDVKFPPETQIISIDHHGRRANEDPSIKQVCELLKIPITREIELIAANDAGWIPALRKIGATDEEIKDIRARDRKAQGFDEVLEGLSKNLAQQARIIPELNLAIASNLPITRFAGIKDAIATKHSIYNIISIAKPQNEEENGEMEFQGDGKLCAALSEKYGGWSGGDGLGKLGGTAFWGGYQVKPQEIVDFIKQQIAKEYPHIPKQKIRDAIIKGNDYGKVVDSFSPYTQLQIAQSLVSVDAVEYFRPISTRYIRSASEAAEAIVKRILENQSPRPSEAAQVAERIQSSLPSPLIRNAEEAKRILSFDPELSRLIRQVDALRELLLFHGLVHEQRVSAPSRGYTPRLDYEDPDGPSAASFCYISVLSPYTIAGVKEGSRFQIAQADYERVMKDPSYTPQLWLQTVKTALNERSSEEIMALSPTPSSPFDAKPLAEKPLNVTLDEQLQKIASKSASTDVSKIQELQQLVNAAKGNIQTYKDLIARIEQKDIDILERQWGGEIREYQEFKARFGEIIQGLQQQGANPSDGYAPDVLWTARKIVFEFLHKKAAKKGYVR